MDELRFWLLGPLQVWSGEIRLDSSLDSPRLKSLLALMLTLRNQFVPTERLMECLWPEVSPRSAVNNLQVAVSQLRRWLEPALHRAADSRYLKTEPGGYRFLLADCYLDVDDFETAVQRGQTALRRGDWVLARSNLEHARQLYHGDYLSDLPYAEWVLATRERLRDAHLQALKALAETYHHFDLQMESIAVCRQALAIDPLRESFTRQRMRSHAALEQRAEALAAYEECRQVLAEELGIEPSAETQSLRQAILAGTLAAAKSVTSTAVPPAVELPLVGRAEALAALQSAWKQRQGSVIVFGPAGIGKTRLLSEFGAMSGPGGPGALLAARQGEAPFGTGLRCLAAYLQQRPPVAALASLGSMGAPLAQALPLLRELWPGCPPYTPLTAEAERERLHHALLAGLRLAAAERSLFLCDDWHLADEASLAVFDRLLSGANEQVPSNPAGQALFVFAYRSEELPGNRPLADWLASLHATQAPLEVELTGLNPDDVLDAVRDLTSLPDPVWLSQRLYEATAGQPLFLTESIRGLIDSGGLYRDTDGTWRLAGGMEEADLQALVLSDTLRETILARAGRLEPFEREVLDAAAVLRPRPTPLLLGTILDADAVRLQHAMHTLAVRRWLMPVGDGPDAPQEWEFGHHLTAEVLHADLTPSHRRLLHRLAANALIENAPHDPGPRSAEIVSHLQQGDASAGPIARWAILAGQWANQQFTYRQALAYFEVAGAQLQRLPDSEEKRVLALGVYEGLGTVQPRVGQSNAAVQSLQEALVLAAAPVDRVRLLLRLAQIHEYDAAEYERAASYLEEAEALLQQAGSADHEILCEIHTIQSRIHYWRGEYLLGERLARRALQESHQTSAEPGALNALALNLLKLGRTEEAIERHRRLLDIARTSGNLRGLATTQINLGLSLQALGKLSEALHAYEEARQGLEKLDDRRSQSIVYANLGIVTTYLGNLAGAEVACRRAIELADAVGAPYTVALARHFLGYTLALRGRWQEARDAFEASIELAEAIQARVIAGQAHLHYGLFYAWPRDELAAARAHAEVTLAVGEELGDNFCKREARYMLGLLALAAGDLAAAGQYAGEAHQLAAEAQQALTIGHSLRLLGQIAIAAGRADEAEAHFAESERILRSMEASIELAETLLARAKATRALGEPAATWQPWLLEARRLLQRAGAIPLWRQVRVLLAEVES